jgi:hypothetical protein
MKNQYLSVLFLTKLASSKEQEGPTFLQYIFTKFLSVSLDVAWVLLEHGYRFIAASDTPLFRNLRYSRFFSK